MSIFPAYPFAEVNQIIDSLSNRKHKAELSLLYSSGIRVSELCRLHCGDIYISKNAVYISRSKNRSDRYAVLSKKALSHLTAYLRQDYPYASKSDWLFPGQKPGTYISKQSVYNTLMKQPASLGWQDRGFNCTA